MFREILSKYVNLRDEQLNQFQKFYEMVIDWNTKINLTAITDEKEFAIKHVMDSLTLWDEEKFSNVKKILDVGTGAGFPAIPIKIFKPNVEIFLLDSLAKRVDFLQKVIAELNLQNVTCIHGRAEDLARQTKFRDSFDLVTARAVARLNIISEYCLPFVKIGGTFAALKGKQFAEEIAEAENAIKILGGGKIICVEKTLPEIPDNRAVIYIDKQKSTPKNFRVKQEYPPKIRFKA